MKFYEVIENIGPIKMMSTQSTIYCLKYLVTSCHDLCVNDMLKSYIFHVMTVVAFSKVIFSIQVQNTLNLRRASLLLIIGLDLVT